MPILRLPKFGKQVQYAYITGRVRVMKTKLIPDEMYSRMMIMDIAETVRYLKESQYKDEMGRLSKDYSGAELIEHATYANIAKTYRKLLKFSVEEPHFLILEYLKRWDIWNIKILLRTKFYGADETEIIKYLVPAGELSEDFLLKLAKIETIQKVISAFDETDYSSALIHYDEKGLATVENALDKLYYFRLERVVGGTQSVGSSLMLKYVRREIDIRNLITLFRMNKTGIEASVVQDNLIHGGKFYNELSRLAGQPFGEFLRGLERYPFWAPISNIAEPSLDAVSRVEARLKAYLIRYIWTISIQHPLSILPILGYIVSKENEVANIRKIARGKDAGLPMELINEMVVRAQK
jgi:V/A-type H+-transporting ATPase subunit C